MDLIFSHLIAAGFGAVIMAQLIALNAPEQLQQRPEKWKQDNWPETALPDPTDGQTKELSLFFYNNVLRRASFHMLEVRRLVECLPTQSQPEYLLTTVISVEQMLNRCLLRAQRSEQSTSKTTAKLHEHD
jgi:hypothetical protein